MHKLIKKIQTFSHQFNLWQEGDKIVVGVSGGPDSVCLLDILVRLSKKRKFKLMVAHVNYGLRGKDSDKDEIFVRKLIQEYNLKLEILDAKNITPPSNLPLKEGGRMPSENYLRNLRYEFFEKVRKENKFDLIAVAHNQDDQAETILMRLIRGSGLSGLSSIRPKNNLIIRPLLNISRTEIKFYLKENKLKFRVDKTNKENKFLRNKIRNKLIPLIEKDYNPQLRETLSGAASSIADDYDFILQSADKFLKTTNFTLDQEGYSFNAKVFVKNHRAIQRQILRGIIFKLKDNLYNIENSHLDEIIKIIKSDKNKSQRLNFQGLKVAKKGDIIYISTEK